MNKIDRALEEKMMKTGAMGTEQVTVNLCLTDSEKEDFINCRKYDSENYAWEFDGNELTISYVEEVEG